MSIMSSAAASGAVSVTHAAFGNLPDGSPAEVYTLKNSELSVRITNYGARIVSLECKDRSDTMGHVVLGYDSVEGYLREDPRNRTYFGAVVGRYGNRIRNGRFTLDGHTYQIPPNDNGNALHGGPVGFSDMLWTTKELPTGVEMTLVSPDGDMGFPGTLTAHVRYTLQGEALHIAFAATTDKPTVLNLVNHAYFNLGGIGSGTTLDQVLMINADQYTPTDAGQIPVGGPQPVAGTPFDFTHPTVISARIHEDNEQLKLGHGYDENWVLRGSNGEMKLAACLTDPKTGRVLTVSTTEPAMQFYGGNHLDGFNRSPSGAPYGKNSGLCLETQHFPDSPNQPAFPTTELKPGYTLHSETIYAFTVEK